MKSLTASVITQLNATGKAPILLFELGLSSTLRYVAYKTNVIFPTGGVITYTAKTIILKGFEQSLEGQIDRINLQFDNVQRDMSAYADIEDFRGKSLIIKRTYADVLTNALNYVEVFNGSMERPSEISPHFLSISATIGKPLNRLALKFPYQVMCPWIFGDSKCNTDGNADLTVLKATGTADSGSTTTLVDNALTQVDDHWNFGIIEVTKAGKMYSRRVADFVAASDTITFDVELPFTVDGTCTYILYKGCDQTWNTCNDLNAWGPSADNTLNFGGCLHILRLANAS